MPLLIHYDGLPEGPVYDVLSGLEHRICQINLNLYPRLGRGHTISQIEKLWTAMQVPFPELEGLYLAGPPYVPVLPDSFLGGSAPSSILQLVWHPISGVNETNFIYNPPRRTFPCRYSSFRVLHLARGDGHLPLH